MIKQLPVHKAPSLELSGLSSVKNTGKNTNKINPLSEFWLLIGHALVLFALTIVANFTIIDTPWRGGVIFGSLVIACCFYWKYHLSKNVLLRETIARLDGQVEQLSDKTWELREGEERYRSLVEAFGDSVMHRYGDGTITFTNDSFAGILDKTPEELIGTRFKPQSLVGDKEFPPLNKQGIVHEICIESKNGKRWYSWLDVPIRDAVSGRPAIRSIVRDVTRHKETEAALRDASEKAETASRAKTRFLANVSHEMRTPLNGILGMSDLLSDTELTPNQNTYNEAIHTSGAALLTLIEDILDITRIEANKFEMRRDEINLAQQVEHVAELLSVRAHSKGIGLSTYISSNIPSRVAVDAGRLRQVLINLLGNGVKFTEHGEVCLRVTLAEKKPAIRFEVEDTGPGISIEDKRRIFDEFVQIDDENTRKYGGAGLGLAISQAIIREMGGEISIESDGRTGTVFSFELDLEVQPNQRKQSKPLDDCSVLIISGSKLESAALAQTIVDAGGEAGGGENLDYILVDAATSRDPVQSLDAIKTQSSENTRSIILLTPESREELQSYLDNGFDAYLIKPVRGNSLLKILAGESSPQEVGSPDAPLKKQVEEPKAHGDATRILLAEDNDINALLAKSVLEKEGHFVCHVVNGQLAVTEFQRSVEAGQPYDLILMDFHMPVMDGLNAISQISQYERENGLSAVRKIILSADEQSETRIEAENAGADDYLSKPFKPARLMEIARECANANPIGLRAAK
ncbi:MAG: response regulator [Rhizobiaceae bacterium]|nr:response regulator [Rhizobiaceae bacterium]